MIPTGFFLAVVLNWAKSRKEALKRECIEELGLVVQPYKLLLVFPSHKPETFGHLEHFFLCKAINKIGVGRGPEFQPNSNYRGKYEIKRVKLENLAKIDLKPNEVRDLIIKEQPR